MLVLGKISVGIYVLSLPILPITYHHTLFVYVFYRLFGIRTPYWYKKTAHFFASNTIPFILVEFPFSLC
jgi:hypothetical protein